jgi:predicted metal-dependent phosphoesterase TrpH
MRKRGVSWFSVTDHDTVRAYETLDAPGQHLIPGIEINTTWGPGDVHVLGYRIPTGPSPLADVLVENRKHRRTRITRIVAALNAAGYPITEAEVLSEGEGGHALGRPHVAKALVRRGMVKDVKAAFDTLLGEGQPAYTPSYHITPLEAIAHIRESGGIPVLAHPGRLKDESVIETLIEGGIAGIEVFYPKHENDQIARYRAIAKRANLVMTAGSDFHDPRYNPRGVGMDVDEVDVRPFLDLVG